MGFADQYIHSLNANSLQDDDMHHAAEALFAAAVADSTGAGFGALLSRVKYSDGSVSKLFESGTQNLANLLRVWEGMVIRKGQERRWVKARFDWDLKMAAALYKRVAHRSLAHWLDGKCPECHGTKMAGDKRICPACRGTGEAEVTGHGFERELVLDMVSELEGLIQSHNARAAVRLRRNH